MNKIYILLAFSILLFTNCTDNLSDSGGASETVATIEVSGKTINGSINQQSNFTVKVFNNAFLALDDTSETKYGDTLLSDNQGNFTIELPRTGLFNLLIYDNHSHSLGLKSLIISDSSYSYIDTLTESGTLKGKISFPNDIIIDNLFVSLIGTDLTTFSDSLGYFELMDIPKGEYSLFYSIFESLDSIIDSGNVLINGSETINNISIASGSTEDIVINIK